MTQRLRFGDDFELDPGTYQLYRSGHALKLERIPMEILLLLTARPGEVTDELEIKVKYNGSTPWILHASTSQANRSEWQRLAECFRPVYARAKAKWTKH